MHTVAIWSKNRNKTIPRFQTQALLRIFSKGCRRRADTPCTSTHVTIVIFHGAEDAQWELTRKKVEAFFLIQPPSTRFFLLIPDAHLLTPASTRFVPPSSVAAVQVYQIWDTIKPRLNASSSYTHLLLSRSCMPSTRVRRQVIYSYWLSAPAAVGTWWVLTRSWGWFSYTSCVLAGAWALNSAFAVLSLLLIRDAYTLFSTMNETLTHCCHVLDTRLSHRLHMWR